MLKQNIRLGDEIEDIVAKVRGIAHGRVEYLDGAVFWIIQPASVEYAILAKEVHSQDGYCIKIGEGIRLEKKRSILGFNADELQE